MGMIPFGPLVFQLDNSTQIEINSADAEEVARKAANPPIPLTIPLNLHVSPRPASVPAKMDRRHNRLTNRRT